MMARKNQSAGRTQEAWDKRYKARRHQMEMVAAKLSGTLHTSHVDGPGVPGGVQNRFEVLLPDGTVLYRREAIRQAGLAR